MTAFVLWCLDELLLGSGTGLGETYSWFRNCHVVGYCLKSSPICNSMGPFCKQCLDYGEGHPEIPLKTCLDLWVRYLTMLRNLALSTKLFSERTVILFVSCLASFSCAVLALPTWPQHVWALSGKTTLQGYAAKQLSTTSHPQDIGSVLSLPSRHL